MSGYGEAADPGQVVERDQEPREALTADVPGDASPAGAGTAWQAGRSG